MTFNVKIHLLHFELKNENRAQIQWNPMNPIANEPQKSGCINGVAVLKGLF